MARTRLTDTEREQRRQADRDRLEHAARDLLCTDGWQRWMRVRATNGLARYSIRNQYLIAHDSAARGLTPTYVAGFRAWLTLNRCVRRGEKAIRILAPIPITDRDANNEKTEETRVLFRAVPVFDVAQTEPLPGLDPIALTPPSEPIEGDSHRDLIAPLHRLAHDLGYTVEHRDLGPDATAGWCSAQTREIVIATGPANREVRTLVHELAHAMGVTYSQYGRHQAEVLVDSVTYVVLGSTGLDISGESIPYIAGWGEDGALDAIRTYAQTIDDIARRIENTITPAAPAPADTTADLAAA